jgi:hypothetical protein
VLAGAVVEAQEAAAGVVREVAAGVVREVEGAVVRAGQASEPPHG